MKHKGITFVELMVCIIVASVLMTLLFNFMSDTRHNYMYGVVNIQNLQEARLAINYLKRDFSASCPFLGNPKEMGGYNNFQKMRQQLFVTQDTDENNMGGLMQVYQHGLSFHKYVYGSFGEQPKVENVTYQFNQTTKTLERFSTSKGKKSFTGFEDVKFCLYVHEVNPNVPMLWVKFRINESSNIYASEKIGNALELTTTISSSFVTSSQNNKYWRYETGQMK